MNWGIVLMIAVSLCWSMVGGLVRLSSPMFDPSVITFARFFLGTIAILIYMKIAKIPIRIVLRNKWVWFGAIAKAANYLLENIAIANGSSYGNILVIPVISSVAIISASVYLKEKLKKHQWVAVALCFAGVCFVSWNGLPFEMFVNSNVFNTVLYILAGTGGGFFLLASKQLLQEMESGNLNASMFSGSMLVLLLAVPLVHTMPIDGFFIVHMPPVWSSVIAILVLGFSTGISFLIYNKALKMVPFAVSAVLVNTCVFWQMIWSKLFFKSDQPISIWAWMGAVVILVGIVLLNLNSQKGEARGT